MKQVLLISHSFPPSNSMAAHRNYLRAKALDFLGYQVTVLASKEPGPESGDQSAPQTERKLFRRSRCIRISTGFRYSGVSLFIDRIFDNLFYLAHPMDHRSWWRLSHSEIRKLLGPKIDYVISSGDPWSSFALGKKVAKVFAAKYIAEYRDPWNYHDRRFAIEGLNTFRNNPWSQFKRRLAHKTEIKLNRDADLIIAASDPFLKNALAVTGNPNGLTVTNGYDPDEFATSKPLSKSSDRFTMTYVGSMYTQQRADIFFKALNQWIKRAKIDPMKLRVILVGTGESHGFEKTKKYIDLLECATEVVQFTERVTKSRSLQYQMESHLLLFFAHRESIGIMPGKIFEYIAIGTPILLAPSDHGVLAALIDKSRSGWICDSESEIADLLDRLFKEWQANQKVTFEPNLAEIEKYHYIQVTKKLAEALERL